MKNYQIFSLIAYMISNYEKGRIKSTSFWSKKYIASLDESIKILILLVDLISNNKDVSNDNISKLQNYIDNNYATVFNNKLILVDYIKPNDNTFVVDDYTQIIDLMYTILYKIKTLLYCRPNKYKFVISYLLKSFHNLPRVFFPQDTRVFLGIHISSISPSDALLYANSYFKL